MTAFFIVNVTVNDPELFQEYGSKMGPTLKAFGGEPVIRGKYSGQLDGETAEHKVAAVVKFPSLEKLNAWHASPEYQALIELRDRAADVMIATYEVPSA